MTWKDVNVFQWQQILSVYENRGDMDDTDLYFKLLGILMNMTESQIDSLPIEKIKPLAEKGKFLHEEMKPVQVKHIKVNGRRYRCVYDIKKLPSARYIETKHFQKDTNANLHRIMACMVIPQKRNWFGMWVDDKYDATEHERYANDLLEAPIEYVIGSVVFFYAVYQNWIKLSKDFLVLEMTQRGMTKKKAEEVHQTLCNSMDGYIKSNWLPTMRESVWKMLTNLTHYNFLMTSHILKQNQSMMNNK